MNKYLEYFLIALAFGIILYVGYFWEKALPLPSIEWETKINEEPPVSISTTPLELGNENGTWKFDIAFDTHSGSLDGDPLKSALITDEKGNKFYPIAWEGPGPGGHHREGALVFNAVKPPPKIVTLKFINVGGIAERSFDWNIE